MGTHLILITLKKILKSKKIKYSELSHILNMSESGLKKMMSAEDISMARLIRICEACEVSLEELIQMCKTEEIQHVEFTPAQNDLLLKNSLALKIFWKLTIENLTADEIKKTEKITSRDFQKILFSLEKVDLLKTNSRGHVVSIHKGLHRWNESSPFVKKINKNWSTWTLEKTFLHPDQSFQRLSYVQLTKKQRDQFIEKFSDLMNDLARAHQIAKLENTRLDLLPLSVVFAATKSGVFE